MVLCASTAGPKNGRDLRTVLRLVSSSFLIDKSYFIAGPPDYVGSKCSLGTSLAKCEIKCLNARIEELDFEDSVDDWTLLPDELIESGLSNFAGTVRGCVNATVFPGDGAIQSHDKPHGPAVFCGSQHQVQVAAVETEHDLARYHLQHGAFGIHAPRPAQSPMV